VREFSQVKRIKRKIKMTFKKILFVCMGKKWHFVFNFFAILHEKLTSFRRQLVQLSDGRGDYAESDGQDESLLGGG